MLSYFPTPYPHEWMYSVFCRYHLRSGRQQSQTTIRELFGNRPTAAIGSIFPNSTISQIIAQLPPGCFNARELMTGHTLFPYYTRCYTLSQKEKLLDQLSLGTSVVITSIRRFGQLPAPRYCPCCVEQDRGAYGEAYWHIDHQIPAMQVCPKHKCRLLHIDDIDFISVKDTFRPLDTQNLVAPPYEKELQDKWKIQFSKVLFDYATLPLSFAATPGHNNLSITLGNMGYAVTHGCDIYESLDASRLYQDVKEQYGSNFVSKIFSSEKAVHYIHQVCNWSSKFPEQYALLQCFSGINSSTVFSSTRFQNTYMADEEKIYCCQDESDLCFSEHMSTWLDELHIEFLKIYTSSTDILIAPQDFLAKLAELLVRADEEYCHVNMPEGAFREFISKMKQRKVQAALILLEQLLDGYQPKGKYSGYPNWTWDTGNFYINKHFGVFAIKQYFSVLANQVLRAKIFGF